MTKVCSVCNTENKDDAQFCRSCGTSFASAPAPSVAPMAAAADGASDNVCGECGFQNKPGIRYCANCGMSLTTASSGFGDLSRPIPPAAITGTNPPPLSYQSFAPVAPYPAAPSLPPEGGPSFDNLTVADIPDADASIAVRQQAASNHYEPPAESGFSSTDDVFTPKPSRTRFIAIAVVAALVVLGAIAWWFMGSGTSSAPAESAAAPTPPVVSAPVAPVAASAPAPVIIEAASAPVAAPVVEAPASAPETAAAPPVAVESAASASTSTPPAAAAPLPQMLPPAAAPPLPRKADVAPTAPIDPAAAEAKRLAADKARREKAARDKADRDAKALTQQRDQAAAAAAKAEQDAQAKRRSEDAQRVRATPAPALTPALPPQARGVKELCAGRGAIAEAVCQSRQCAAAEHANEAVCRQIREADDRRRNYQN